MLKTEFVLFVAGLLHGADISSLPQLERDGVEYEILLDFHFPDTWADPGHQSPPAAWSGLSVSAMADSLESYTQDVLTALSAQDTPPAIVRDNAGARWFFDNLIAHAVDFDLIGRDRLPVDAEVVRQHPQPRRRTPSPATAIPRYPGRSEQFLDELIQVVRDVPESRGRGVVWWAPEWIATPEVGSPWENLTLFDEDGDALEGLESFGADEEKK